jgi:hypothetical protein
MDSIYKLFEIKNKGHKAGGAKANKNGKSYEKYVDCTDYLINNKNFKINDKYIKMINNNLEILIFKQKEFNKYLKIHYNKDIYRIPDQTILIKKDNNIHKIIIIEIKNQNVNGSVEDKLWASIGIKQHYQYWLKDYTIEYMFILNTFLFNLINNNKKKYKDFKFILNKSNIKILNGDDNNYKENYYNLIINY